MSMPTIPPINGEINITKEEALNIIIASIGFEELGLAHLINAEAEKIQFALGTLETADGAQDFEDILAANESAAGVLKNAIKMQVLLGMKLDDALDAYDTIPVTPVGTGNGNGNGNDDECEENEDENENEDNKDKDKESEEENSETETETTTETETVTE